MKDITAKQLAEQLKEKGFKVTLVKSMGENGLIQPAGENMKKTGIVKL